MKLNGLLFLIFIFMVGIINSNATELDKIEFTTNNIKENDLVDLDNI